MNQSDEQTQILRQIRSMVTLIAILITLVVIFGVLASMSR